MTDDDPGVVDRDAVQRGYDEVAHTYAEERSGGGLEADLLDTVVEGCPDDALVLDAGCGQGWPVLQQLERQATAVGLDVSAEQLRLADRNAPSAALFQGDMTRLPFQDDAFDAAVAFHSLIHVPLADHSATVEEFARVLAPGGRLLLSEGPGEWTGSNPDWLDAGVEMQWAIAGADRTREQLRAAGFSIDEEHESGHTLDDEEHWHYFDATLDGRG